MAQTKADLPKDVGHLQQMVFHYSEEIEVLREQNRLLKAKLFGRSSERFVPDADDQPSLFGSPSTRGDEGPEAAEPENVKGYKRKKTRRPSGGDELPTECIEHDISDEEKQCECGACRVRIGEETNDEYEYSPAQIKRLRHIRPKYACPQCEGGESAAGGIKIAPPVKQLIAKGIGTPSLYAHILGSRYADAIPFYRQENMFKRLGLALGRASMSQWAGKLAKLCAPIMELMLQDIKNYDYVQIDETRLQVLGEPGRSNTSKSQMWVMRGGPPGANIIYFRYDASRSSTVAAELLEGFEGYVQSDGYAGYNFLEKTDGVVPLACWAHVHRKFVEVVKANRRNKRGKQRAADQVLGKVKELYAIEAQAKKQNLTFDERLAKRQAEAPSVLDDLKALLDDLAIMTPPTGLLGKAVAYTLKLWPKLIRYVDIAQAQVDNNRAENAIRPFVVGRKNWLFAGSPSGAQATATFFTLIETAKANGWDPYAYLGALFNGLLNIENASGYIALLPTSKPSVL